MLSAKNVLSLVVKVVEVLITRLAIEIVLCTELNETTNSLLLQTSFSAYIQLVQFNFSVSYIIFTDDTVKRCVGFECFVLMKSHINKTGAPNDNFRKNICSEDDLRSRIF